MDRLQQREEKRKQSIIESVIKNEPDKNETSSPVVVQKEKAEKRSRQIIILTKPSIHKEVQKRCKKIGISVNECMNQLLENWIKNES